MITKPCTVVAEIGATHIGNMERAKYLIKLAMLSGAHYAKFQKRNPIESLPLHLHNCPHPNIDFAYGKTYLEHRQNLEFTLDQHKELMAYCSSIGIKYATSVWDETSAREIISLNPEYIKVPSACNHNYSLINLLCDEYSGFIHISCGMISNADREQMIHYLLQKTNPQRLVFYHCTSRYPCPFEDLHLNEIQRLYQQLEPTGAEIGFSNHGFGIATDPVAYAAGATWIERHFIDDRTFKHTDAAASLEPQGLHKLCRDLENIKKSMTFKTVVSQEEIEQRTKLRINTAL